METKSCSFLVHFESKGSQLPPARLADEIKLPHEDGNNNDDVRSKKIETLKNAIMLLLINGEATLVPHELFVITSIVEDLTVHKLMLLYLEMIIERTDHVKVPETIVIICRYLRFSLLHPNEFIRGVTLRSLCRLNNETEIIQPLITSIITNLTHPHSYVRRNAFLAVMSIYNRLVPPQCDLVDGLFVDKIVMLLSSSLKEQDASVKRNAFLLLSHCAQGRAVNYVLSNADRISDWETLLQMVVLEFILKVCRTNKAEKGKFINIVISLMDASLVADSVVYESAGTLVSLTSAPTAIRAASYTYCQLLLFQSTDDIAKLVLLDRLNELNSSHKAILDMDMIMDLLIWALSSTPNLDIRRKILDVILEQLIMPHNVNLVVRTLRDELIKTQSGELEYEYRRFLVLAICTCAIKFPEVGTTVAYFLMDFFLGDDNNVASAMDVLVFAREIIETNAELRGSIVTRLLDNFYGIRAARVCSFALWIIGEYCLSLTEVESSISTIKHCLGDLPFLSISDSFLTTGNLRSLLLSGDFSLGVVVAWTLTKLVRRLEVVQPSKVEVNKASNDALLIMVSMLQLGQSSVLPSRPIDNDSRDKIILCIRLLCNTRDVVQKARDKTEEVKANVQIIFHSQADDLIDFYHLKSIKGMSQLKLEDEVVQVDLKSATEDADYEANNKLNHIVQLTGFSDPVYAEAYVTARHHDIILDVTVINRTSETLENLCLELSTIGHLKLVERPQNFTLAPDSSKKIKANIKLSSSTETGVIFGNIVYEISNGLDRTVLVLNDIHIDMGYLCPDVCRDTTFRTTRNELEMENMLPLYGDQRDKRSKME